MNWRKKPIKDWTIEDVGACVWYIFKVYTLATAFLAVGLILLCGALPIILLIISSPAPPPPTPTTTPRPVARAGDIIPEVGADTGNKSLSLAFISWKESNIAVVGPYRGDEFYTFTAKPGMKFIILIFEFRNSWIREQQTPYLSAGEVLTDKGYLYRVWSPPLGVHSEEYRPRESTEEEVRDLVGSSGGGLGGLLPEESAKGCTVFEIPEGEMPIEANIVHVPRPIRFQ